MELQQSLFGLLLLTGMALFTTSCMDDPCKDTTCNNGGICVDGTCDCPEGFSGPNCDIADLCHEANQNHEWGYDHAGGPDCWGGVCTESACGGSSQSPVNIANSTVVTDLPNLQLSGHSTKTKITNNGHTVVFEQEPGAFITYGNLPNGSYNDLTLGQFHFHAKSEHEIDGSPAALEAHFVCRSIWSDQYIVMAVLFEKGASNPNLEKFISKLPTTAGQTVSDDNLAYNAFDFLPSNRSYYTYEGSLTTPPCTEVVKWIVMKNKVEASEAQINAMVNILGANSRPVQPLNGRAVKQVVL